MDVVTTSNEVQRKRKTEILIFANFVVPSGRTMTSNIVGQ